MKHILYFLLLVSFFFACTTEEPAVVGPEITLPEGFEAELIYAPSANNQGSWVSLTTDDRGGLFASDQYGGLYRVTLSESGPVQVDSIPLQIGRAQGMLWAFNSLYVTVNSFNEEITSGLYQVTDSDGDGELDKVTKLFALDGAGEHGPHAVMLGPDGKQLYLIAGNHTNIPEPFASVLPKNWEVDRLFPPILDPRGHANDRTAPGGWIARFNPDGSDFEVVATGFRNSYDIAFNQNGDLFTFDSDMEWDLGSPWYRPIRVCHVIPGAEFGWRSGSGKWPAYYPDNLPGMLDIGQGSPTGIVFGYDAKFPEAYQRSLYISDWSFGTIYQVSLTPSGASYTAEKKEFLSGTPLPVTDLVIGDDGNMYFTSGGRRTESFLYRVRYTGTDATDPVQDDGEGKAARETRNRMADANVSIDELWAGLGHEDRFVRYAARVGLENQQLDAWKGRLSSESDPMTIMQASIAAIRVGGESMRDAVLRQLKTVDVEELSIPQQLDFLRAYGLVFIRTGAPTPGDGVSLPSFPSGNPAMDRELGELLVYLDQPSVVPAALAMMEQAEENIDTEFNPVEVLERSEQYGPTIAAMYENRPAEQGMALAMALSHMKSGWTPELRYRYFTWFYRELAKSGGESYKGFVEKIRLQALANVPEEAKAELAEASGEALLQAPTFNADVPPPVGPGRDWKISEANRLVGEGMHSRSYDRGYELYQGLLCAACHTMNGEGGNVGPDLTQAGTRFSNYDILNAMILPSVSISDQYGATLYTLADGSTLIGRAIQTTADSVHVSINPFSSETRAIALSDVAEQVPSPVSLMPAGLINSLNEEELLDLMAFIKSGGDPENEVYKE